MTPGSRLSAPRPPHHSPHHTTVSSSRSCCVSHSRREVIKRSRGTHRSAPPPAAPKVGLEGRPGMPSRRVIPTSTGVLICSSSKVRSAAPGLSQGDGGPGVTGDPHHSLPPPPLFCPNLPSLGFMKYLGSFIFPPAVIHCVLTTRLLLGTGLSKYPRLSWVPIAVWTYTCGYLSSGAPAPGTVWEVCACVSGVIPVSVPACPCDSVCNKDCLSP